MPKITYNYKIRCGKCAAFKKHDSSNPSLCLRCGIDTETIDEAAEAYYEELIFNHPVEYL